MGQCPRESGTANRSATAAEQGLGRCGQRRPRGVDVIDKQDPLRYGAADRELDPPRFGPLGARGAGLARSRADPRKRLQKRSAGGPSERGGEDPPVINSTSPSAGRMRRHRHNRRRPELPIGEHRRDLERHRPCNPGGTGTLERRDERPRRPAMEAGGSGSLPRRIRSGARMAWPRLSALAARPGRHALERAEAIATQGIATIADLTSAAKAEHRGQQPEEHRPELGPRRLLSDRESARTARDSPPERIPRVRSHRTRVAGVRARVCDGVRRSTPDAPARFRDPPAGG